MLYNNGYVVKSTADHEMYIELREADLAAGVCLEDAFEPIPGLLSIVEF